MAVLFLAPIPLLEFAAFLLISLARLQPPAGPVDLIAVFGGNPDRIQHALLLAPGIPAKAFVISDSSPAEVQSYFRAWGRPGQAEVLYEPFARTTDQNARFVGKLVRERHFKTVLLLTSWYHLPRACLLLKLDLCFSGVRVSCRATEAAPAYWLLRPEFWREMGKLWGSLARWGLDQVGMGGMLQKLKWRTEG